MKLSRALVSVIAVGLSVSILAACSGGTESSVSAVKARTKNGSLISNCGSTNTNLNNMPNNNTLINNSNLLTNQNIINSNQNINNSNQIILNIPTNNNLSNNCIIDNINNSNLINNLPTTTSTTTTVAANITIPRTTTVVSVPTSTTPPTTSVVAVSTPVTTLPKCVVTASQSSVKWCKLATSWRLFVEVKNRPAPTFSGNSATGVMVSMYRVTGTVTALAATVTFKDSTKATFVFKGIGTPTEIFPK